MHLTWDLKMLWSLVGTAWKWIIGHKLYSFLIVLGYFMVKTTIKGAIRKRTAKKYEEIGAKKRSERSYKISQFFTRLAAKFEKYEKVLTPELKETILNASITELKDLLNQRKIKSKHLVYLFAKKCASEGIEYEMLAEVNFDEAFEMARQFDRMRKKNPELAKSLLIGGIPMSFKDHFQLKGLDATAGCATLANKPQEKDGLIARLLMAQGAIPLVTSNVPQLLVLFETTNRIWGRTKNPWNKLRSPGGSSGGEAALVASRCVPLGLGSDMGGSVRVPAFHCGIAALKPTVKRVTSEGMTFPAKEKDPLTHIFPMAGPMARKVEDLAIALRCLLNDQNLLQEDPTIPFSPFNEDLYTTKRKLKIGVCMRDDIVNLAPPNERALREVAQILKDKCGHEVIEVELPNYKLMSKCYLNLMGRDMFIFMKELLDGEPFIDEYLPMEMMFSMPLWFLKIFKLLFVLMKDTRTKEMFEICYPKTLPKLYEIFGTIRDSKQQFQAFWKQNQFDALIIPCQAIPALRHGTANELAMNGSYNWVVNLLGNPAGIVPVTEVRSGETVYKEKLHKDYVSQITAKSLTETEGLPIGVQVLGQLYQDEMVLNVMKQIEAHIPPRKSPL